jgi:hypothetical protein
LVSGITSCRGSSFFLSSPSIPELIQLDSVHFRATKVFCLGQRVGVLRLRRASFLYAPLFGWLDVYFARIVAFGVGFHAEVTHLSATRGSARTLSETEAESMKPGGLDANFILSRPLARQANP